MSGAASNPGDIFDVRRIRRLVELMNEHELSEIDLRQSDVRIRLRRGHDPVIVAGNQTMAAPANAGQPMGPAGTVAPVKAAPAEDQTVVIKSPMVGTFYAASSPESAPFIKVGDHVGPTSTVCIVEAMKVFNEIQAELSGQVVAVLAQPGEPVEFGQPLFRVDPRQ